MDVVTKVLEEAAKQAEQFKSIDVDKHLELEYDLGTLLAVDTNDLDLQRIRFVLYIGYVIENFLWSSVVAS
jgi:regulator of ribosome biosynthesis